MTSPQFSQVAMTDADALLAPLRERLNEVDENILELIVTRMQLCFYIARLKAEKGIPMMQSGRVQLVIGRARDYAAAHDLPPSYLGGIFEQIIAETCTQEDALIARLTGGQQ